MHAVRHQLWIELTLQTERFDAQYSESPPTFTWDLVLTDPSHDEKLPHVARIRVGTVSHDDLGCYHTILDNIVIIPGVTSSSRRVWTLAALRRLRDAGLADIPRVDEAFARSVLHQARLVAAARKSMPSIVGYHSIFKTVEFV